MRKSDDDSPRHLSPRTRSDSESAGESSEETDSSDSPRYDDEPNQSLFPRYWWNIVSKRYYCDNISCIEAGYPQFNSICEECDNSHWTFMRWYTWAMEEEKGLFRAIYYFIKNSKST